MPALIGMGLALSVGPNVALGQSTGSLPTAPAQAPASKGMADALADCMQLWDKGTHMTKREWSRTCHRIQSRLQNLKIENLKGMGLDAPKRSRTGSRDGSSAPN
ncbi:MAG: hypothetical protein AB7G08_18900 [Hyphomicrobiaceae bacterium]